MHFREVVGSCESVPPSPHDDDIVARLRRGISPRWPPAAMARECLTEQVQK